MTTLTQAEQFLTSLIQLVKLDAYIERLDSQIPKPGTNHALGTWHVSAMDEVERLRGEYAKLFAITVKEMP